MKRETSLCRHCGYVFAPGGPAGDAAGGSTAALATGAARPAETVTLWLKLAGPVVLIVAAAGLLLVRCQSSRRQATWERAVAQAPAGDAVDRQFATWVAQLGRAEPAPVQVHASRGVCLINIPQGGSRGLLAKMGGKLAATGFAVPYAALREFHGQPPVAQVVIYVDGRRLSQGEFDARKHPELYREWQARLAYARGQLPESGP
ncbi:hypothetical protein HQ590_15500 [bacterium]|nr:hypothetical protein [bacterium]